jgi:hypothetical protein
MPRMRVASCGMLKAVLALISVGRRASAEAYPSRRSRPVAAIQFAKMAR